ncbi:Putative uncharacterized transposon-derived protein F52C9.6 [Eumeta japonica]|uniref:Uncharacterized transposon-derived protein F52C9.6 n=1 Tax=Eumeta variegata TaxID=151549 RepID=A0A4C1UEC0_EUMVA|nr:Putative uncharacterized transposon-derived protein F52C9.6 [Eumeta japonica]
MGKRWHKPRRQKLKHLRFADDLVLITDNATTLQHMLQQLTEASRKVGLTMNGSKTKVMTNREEIAITVHDSNNEYVRTYTYLGQIIAFRDQTNIEIERRVANAWNRYCSLKEILKSEHFLIAAKRKVFNSCVLPCLTYGCQTWALSQKHLLKLRTCQRGMERSMIGVTKKDRIRSEDIRSITKIAALLRLATLLAQPIESSPRRWPPRSALLISFYFSFRIRKVFENLLKLSQKKRIYLKSLQVKSLATQRCQQSDLQQASGAGLSPSGIGKPGRTYYHRPWKVYHVSFAHPPIYLFSFSVLRLLDLLQT